MAQYYDGHKITFSGSNGYPTIYVDGRNVLLHRYVWEKHHGEIPEGCEIHHKDKDKTNFEISNLELVGISEHHKNHAIDHGLGHCNKGRRKTFASGFCGEPRPVIARKDGEELRFESMSEASRVLEIRVSDIGRILRGKRRTAKGWCFEYAG